MANSPRNSIGNVRSDMDITYPEPLSRLHRHSALPECLKSVCVSKKNTRNRRGNRYRTQPVTFDEIQEVDEETMAIDNPAFDPTDRPVSSVVSTSELRLDFYRFSKALDSKRKKIEPDPTTVVPEKSNGEQPEGNQISWTDYTREASV